MQTTVAIENETTKDIVHEAIKALTTSGIILALFKSLAKAVPSWFERRRQETFVRSVAKIRSVYCVMESAVEKDGAERVLLLAAHNSGGIPTVGTPFYTSAIYWVTGKASNRALVSYKNITVDGAYIAMLLESRAKGSYHFKMDENDGTQLKEFYQAEGVTDSLICYLGILENQFMYMSFATYGEPFAANQLTSFKIRAAEVKDIMFPTK